MTCFAPGTGTPECGGFSSLEMLSLIRKLSGINIRRRCCGGVHVMTMERIQVY